MEHSGVKTEQRNLREEIRAQGRMIGWVAEQVGMDYRTFGRQGLKHGRFSTTERDKLAEVLGLTSEQIDAVLAETARRPGKGEAA